MVDDSSMLFGLFLSLRFFARDHIKNTDKLCTQDMGEMGYYWILLIVVLVRSSKQGTNNFEALLVTIISLYLFYTVHDFLEFRCD